MWAVTQGPVGIPHHCLSLSLSSWHLSYTWIYGRNKNRLWNQWGMRINESYPSVGRVIKILMWWRCQIKCRHDYVGLCDARERRVWDAGDSCSFGIKICLIHFASSWHDLAGKLRMFYIWAHHTSEPKKEVFYIVNLSANVMYFLMMQRMNTEFWGQWLFSI